MDSRAACGLAGTLGLRELARPRQADTSAAPFRRSRPSRTEDAAGKTSPEELIAAAHAACLPMALSAVLVGGVH